MREQTAGEERAKPGGATPCSSEKQTAILFALLLALQFAVAVLTPMGTPAWGWGRQAVFGASLACPPLLAVWAVFGPQRALVRLSLTLWLALAINFACAYGMNQNEGERSESVLLVGAAWLFALAAFSLLMWPVRAIRRWRLSRVEPSQATSAENAGPSAAKSRFQFSLRSLLGWILAATVLLGAFRATVPPIDWEADALQMALQTGAVAELSFEAARVCLAYLLEGLPVIALSWIVLADGRRPMLRGVLSLLMLLWLAALYGIVGEIDDFFEPGEALVCEAGALLNGLICLGALRSGGYRLRRQAKVHGQSEAASLPAPVSRMRFAAATAPIVIALAAAGCSVPFRLERWRQAEVHADWARDGIYVDFDDKGAITGLFYNKRSISDEICARIASVGNLVSLDLTIAPITDRQLALLVPLTQLERLALPGTTVTDEGLKTLSQFPKLRFLNLTATQITDAGLVHLAALPELRRLQLCLTDISEESLQTLGELPALMYLDVSLTTIGAEAAAEFHRLHPQCNICCGATDSRLSFFAVGPRTEYVAETGFELTGVGSYSIALKRLHARGPFSINGAGAKLSDEERAYFAARQAEWGESKLLLGGYGSYEFNRGDNPALTDRALDLLCEHQPELEELDLRDSAVTDQGLWKLRTLIRLKRLDVRGAPVSEQGVARLASALPNCEIIR